MTPRRESVELIRLRAMHGAESYELNALSSRGHSIARQTLMMARVLLALSVLATAFLTWGSRSPPATFPSGFGLSALPESQQLEAHRRLQEEGQVKEFKGKILKTGGKFVLEESSNGGNYGSYLLDDQAAQRSMKDKEWW